MSAKSIEELVESICSGSLEERRRAVEELGKSCPGSVPHLISVLETGDNDSRWYASRALIIIGPSCTEALLEAVRKNRDHDLRRYIAAVLGSFEEPDLGMLVDLLGDPDPHIRGMASMALRTAGALALPLLLEIVETADPEDMRRRAAILTLINMDCVDQGVLSDLIKS